MSQYEDDSSLISDGSPLTLDGILWELDFCENISGHKINFQKSKMVWIGSKKKSKDVFHHTLWKLYWNNTTFDLLGVKFLINLEEMSNNLWEITNSFMTSVFA